MARGDLRGGGFAAAIAMSWALFATAVYLPDVGRGFVKDDFRWIEAGRAALEDPANAFLRSRPDFYRPVVELTFSADYAAHGLRPRGYGFTNLALYIACIAATFALSRTVGLSTAAAATAALVWAVNPHGINMAAIWLSGRTALCLTFFSACAAIAAQRRNYVVTALFTAAALGSKEEAVLLPIVLLAWHALVGTGAEDDVAEIGVTRGLIAALMFPTVVYLGLRLHAGAMTPFSAPPYYQLTTEPVKVLRNALEYADRSTTISVVAFGLAFLAWRVRPVLTRRQIRLLAACIIWTVAGFAVTLFVPVRSSLYAVFPSVGAAVACGVLLDAMLDRAAIRSAPLARLALVFGATLLAAIPIYRDRNGRYVEPARLSERALRTIAPQAAATPDGAAIVLHDVDDAASNFVGAFGTFATSAVRMRAGRNVVVWIDPPPGGWQDAGLRPPPPRAVHAEFGVDRGRIFKVGP